MATIRPAGHHHPDADGDREDHHQDQSDQPLSSQELRPPSL